MAYCVECPQYSIRLEALGYLYDCLSGRVQRWQLVKGYVSPRSCWPKSAVVDRQRCSSYAAVIPLSTGIAPSNGGSGPPRKTWCTGSMRAHNPYATRSIQPCLHRWPWSVPISYFIATWDLTWDYFKSFTLLYFTLSCFPSKLPLPMLVSGPYVIRASLGPCTRVLNPYDNLIVYRVRRFCRLTSMTDWHSDRQTDRPRYWVRCGVIMRNCVGIRQSHTLISC